MNIKSRLKRIESALLETNNVPCFCKPQAFLDLWCGESGASVLTYCPKCKEQFEFWQTLSGEARRAGNLTDEH